MIEPTDRRILGPLDQNDDDTGTRERNSRRHRRIRHVLARRQTSITVVIEDIHDPHNASAVLRSCDGVGVLDVHLVYVHEKPPKKSFARRASGSAGKWLRLHRHDTIGDCYARLREEGKTIYAAALGRESEDLYAIDLAKPVALVFGNEMRGVSKSGIEGADATVHIPMQGMVESLNISVACAVTLYEAMRQRRAAGAYDQPELSVDELAALETEWLRK